MHVVHLLGNGFDINADLKTRYSQFLEYYLDIGSEYQPIDDFKKHISNNIALWSDLEVALGQYTQNIETDSQFDLIYEDISEKLKNYLLGIEESLKTAEDNEFISRDNFMKDLVEPENYLKDVTLRQEIKAALGESPGRRIDVITFNYTRTIKLLYPEVSFDIHHIHGNLGQDIILGVNDQLQINNGKFRKSLDVTEALVKPDSNSAMGRDIQETATQLIKKATVLCLFGVSLGTTDKLWWDLIKSEIESRKLTVILFWRTQDGELNREYKIRRVQRNAKAKLAQTSPDQIPDAFHDQVHVLIDSEIFKLRNTSSFHT